MTDALHESERAVDQAKSAYEQAVNGYTKEEHEIAAGAVKRQGPISRSVQSIIDQLVVYAPVASQVYQRNVEPGEYVSPGVPLITLIDFDDIWIHFDLREDLVKTLKVGDRFDVRFRRWRPPYDGRGQAHRDQGRICGWRLPALQAISTCARSRSAPTRSMGTGARPGMSAYLDWRRAGEAR